MERCDAIPAYGRRSPWAGLTFGRGALAQDLPVVAVTQDPTCGGCGKWVPHPREAGFTVTVTEGPVNPRKVRLGVPRDLASCHTAQVGGYVVEGHVPAGAIKRLLTEKPKGTGLAVPGMPAGSPGMEVEGMEPDTYDVVLFGKDVRSTSARYRGGEPETAGDQRSGIAAAGGVAFALDFGVGFGRWSHIT